MFDEVTKDQTADLLELHRNISEERTAFTQDLEQLSFKVVDHAFLRIAQLAGGIVLVIFAGFVVLLYLTRRLFLARQMTRRAVPLHLVSPAPARKHGASPSRRRYPS